jgi:transposase
MEACGSAHYWARELQTMGYEARLILPVYVKPSVKRGKNDAAFASAVCAALSRPNMRFVPVNSAAQQGDLMGHKTRELLVAQRTMIVNAVRGHLSEFGVIAAKGIGRVADLIEKAEADTTLPITAKAGSRVLARQLAGIEKSIAERAAGITAAHQQNPGSRLLASIPGVGAITAAAIVASVPDPRVFKSGRDFSAWLGPAPRQNSSAGKERLGAITKQGNRTIRRLLVLGATALLGALRKRKGLLRDGYALLARRPARASVAMATSWLASPGPDGGRRGFAHAGLRMGVRKTP